MRKREINKVQIRNLRISEFIQFLRDILTLIIKNKTKTIDFGERFSTLAAFLKLLDTLYGKPKDEKLVKLVAALDVSRTSDIIGIKNAVEAFENCRIQKKKESAAYLLEILENYPSNFSSQSRITKSTILVNIGDDFNTKPAREALKDLSLLDWFKLMVQTNEEFMEREGIKVENKAAKQHTDQSITKIRPKIEEAYKLMCNRIESMNEMSNDNIMDKTINEMNVVIDRFNTLIKNRGTNDKNNDELEEEENSTQIDVGDATPSANDGGEDDNNKGDNNGAENLDEDNAQD